MLFLSVTALTFAQETIKMQVKETTAPCIGVAPMDCLQVKIGKEKEWTYFYSNIEGFNFEPGFRYKLKVIKTALQGEIPADASAYKYILKKVVCKRKVKTKQVTPMDIRDKKMILSELNGKKTNHQKVYFTFDSSKNLMYGKSGCNNFNATFKLNNNKLEVSQGAGTLMACDDESMRLEQEVSTVLQQKHFDIETTATTVKFINPKSKTAVMTFNIQTVNDIWSFIDGKRWKLIMLDNTAQDFGKAFIQFDVTNSKVSGNSGCNNFFGAYETAAETITFKGLRSTRMACMNDEVQKTETKVLKYLSDATVRFDVADQTLNFYVDNRLVLMFGLDAN